MYKTVKNSLPYFSACCVILMTNSRKSGSLYKLVCGTQLNPHSQLASGALQTPSNQELAIYGQVGDKMCSIEMKKKCNTQIISSLTLKNRHLFSCDTVPLN